ncbi:MAG: hypothetical protein ACI9TH_000087 [Kiritimatiellia bacterium]|jgi:hypothetical protein
MSWREKIILILMTTVILYGAGDFMLRRLNKLGGGGRVEKAAAETQAAAVRIRALMNESVFTPGEAQGLDRLVAPWERTLLVERLSAPVRVAETAVHGPASTAGQERPVFHYTGYFNIAGQKMALINGMEYTLGEHLVAGTYAVGDIQPQHVTLRNLSTDKTWRLAREGGADQ